MRVDFSPPDITDAECQEVVDALRSGWITTGPRTKTLEKQVAQRCGTTRAACLNSATASLELTLRVLGIGPGDEVIVPAYTYTASASPIVHVGATPVIVDAGQADGGYGLDPGALEAAITPRTKAVIPVDIGGRMCDYPALRAVVDAHSHRQGQSRRRWDVSPSSPTAPTASVPGATAHPRAVPPTSPPSASTP